MRWRKTVWMLLVVLWMCVQTRAFAQTVDRLPFTKSPTNATLETKLTFNDIAGFMQHYGVDAKSVPLFKPAWKQVSATPDDPAAWQALETVVWQRGEMLRYGRMSGELTSIETAMLQHNYALSYLVSLHVISLKPNDADAWAILTRDAAYANKCDVTYQAIRKAASLGPNNPNVFRYALLVDQPSWYGDFDGCVALCRQVMANPKLSSMLTPEMLEALTPLSSRSTDVAAMVDRLNQQRGEYFQKYPLDTDAYKSLVLYLMDKQNGKFIVGNLQPSLRLSIAANLNESGLPEVKYYLEHWLAAAPDSEDANYWMGYTLCKQQSLAAARHQLTRCIGIQPQDPRALISLGWVDIMLHDYRDAQGYLRNAVVYDPGSAKAWYLLGDALVFNGQIDDANAAWRRSAALDPSGANGGDMAAKSIVNPIWGDAHFVAPKAAPGQRDETSQPETRRFRQ